MPRDPNTEARRELEALCRRLATELVHKLEGQTIGAAHHRRIGFTLFLYDFGADGDLAYVSNGNRQDVVKMLHEFLGKVGD